MSTVKGGRTLHGPSARRFQSPLNGRSIKTYNSPAFSQLPSVPGIIVHSQLILNNPQTTCYTPEDAHFDFFNSNDNKEGRDAATPTMKLLVVNHPPTTMTTRNPPTNHSVYAPPDIHLRSSKLPHPTN